MYVIFTMSKKLKLKPWTDKHQKNYLWLYNYIKTNNYKEANENNYIETYKKYLYKKNLDLFSTSLNSQDAIVSNLV